MRKRLTALLVSIIMVISMSVTALADSGDTVVYKTKTGECYHTSTCSSLSRSKIETTLQDANAAGLRACSKCKPPVLDSSVGSTNKKASATKSAAGVVKEKTSKAIVTDATTYSYVLNTNTKKFHVPGCKSIKQMKNSNKKETNLSRDEIVNQGYDPCGNCNP